jgi:hypothetical protein
MFFSKSKTNIDYKRLRKDLIREYGIRMISYSGGLGFLDMCKVEDVSNEQLLELAKKEHFNLKKYMK